MLRGLGATHSAAADDGGWIPPPRTHRSAARALDGPGLTLRIVDFSPFRRRSNSALERRRNSRAPGGLNG